MRPNRTLFIGMAALAAASLSAQQIAAPAPADASAVFKSESRLVLVDSVVTDKKGNYIHGLTAKNFQVFEDNKEQEIKSFSFQADPASPLKDQKHYIVLFFDNASMQIGDQIQARQAAVKFVETNSGQNRLIAVVNFGGTFQIAQNFTNDAERLKQVVNGVKLPTVSSNDTGGVFLSSPELEFGAIDSLLSVRELAKRLSNVPGRKTVVLLTAGFHMTPELLSEVTATIDACNKANVAIYPIDVRGLVATAGARPLPDSPGDDTAYSIVKAAFVPQRGGAIGGGGGGHTAPASPGGSRGSGSTNGSNPGGRAVGGGSKTISTPGNPPQSILPPFPVSALDNQQLMYLLASGTGGFVIVNTNDLFGGMQKILKEEDEYYVLGYSPEAPGDGACHNIKVKVDRGGTDVRSRTGYCSVKPVDLLSGKPVGKELEAKAIAAAPGGLTATMQAPFFYNSPDNARVDFAIDIPGKTAEFSKEKGKMRAAINVLGIAYRPDGSAAARFSDVIEMETDKKELPSVKEQPIHYEKQFDLAAGKYTLKVVFDSGGQDFGKLESPLVIEPYDGKHLRVSSLAWAHSAGGGLSRDAELIAEQNPMVALGVQFSPVGSTRLNKVDQSYIYMEIYEPLMLAKEVPIVAIGLKVTDRETKQQKQDTGLMKVDKYMRPGSPVIPVVIPLPVRDLPPGTYLAELKAVDSAGRSSTRTAAFSVE